MKLAHTISGGGPYIKRYFVGAHLTVAGIPVLQAAAGDYGVVTATTTSTANAVGVTLDTSGSGTLTTQGVTTHMREGLTGVVSVIINPDAVYKIRLSGSATSGTNLTQTTNSSADTAGLTVTITTGDPAPNSPTMDEGTVACIQGANVGIARKIDAVAATTAAAEIPFPQDLASGDIFLIVPATLFPDALNTVQLTSDVSEADASAAWSADADIRTLGLEFDFSSAADARAKTYLYGVLGDHILTN